MKKVVCITTICFVLMICMSCQSGTDSTASPEQLFERTADLQSKLLPVDDNLLSAPEHLLVLDTLLIIHDRMWVNGDSYLFTVADRFTGELLSIFGREGRGPDEFQAPSFMSRLHGETDKIGIHNRRQLSFSELSVDSILADAGQLTVSSIEELQKSFRVTKIQDFIVATGRFSEGRYALFDSKGEIISQTGYYPFQETYDAPYPVLGMAFQSTIQTHPEGNLIVSATTSSANLEILAWNNGRLEVQSVIHSYPPLLEEETFTEGMLSVMLSRDNRWGYQNTDVTENYIYALYSGKPLSEEPFHLGSVILVFDWKGTPVIQLHTDRELSDISAVPDDTGIYGITENEYGLAEIVMFEVDGKW